MKPLFLSTTGNPETLPVSQKIEEENFDNFSMGRYYPVKIGQVMNGRYHIIGKLGFGLGSTVWLAGDIR